MCEAADRHEIVIVFPRSAGSLCLVSGLELNQLWMAILFYPLWSFCRPIRLVPAWLLSSC